MYTGREQNYKKNKTCKLKLYYFIYKLGILHNLTKYIHTATKQSNQNVKSFIRGKTVCETGPTRLYSFRRLAFSL